MNHPSSPPPARQWKPTDQKILAFCCVVGLALSMTVWVARGGSSGQLWDADTSPKRQLRFRVDPNVADWVELAQLPGLGETLARRIVEDREQAGPFRSVKDLERVQGIGPKILKRFQEYLFFPTSIASDEIETAP